MDKLLTFSIASYNIEKYIDKLMNSILDERILDKIEVLVVNDGSKDRTAEITKNYEEKYPQTVRLVDKENGGHGSTINRGIIEASGKYFRALDGDDWADTEALVETVARLENTESDMIIMDYRTCYEAGGEEVETFSMLEDNKEYKFDDIADKVQYIRYHSTIYKTEFLRKNNIRLDEHCFYVDSEYMLFSIPLVDTVTYFALALYCYRIGIGEQSVSFEGRMKHIADGHKVAKKLLECYKNMSEDISSEKREYVTDGVAAHCTYHYNSLLIFKASKEKKDDIIAFDKMLKEKYPEIYDRINDMSILIKILRKTNYVAYPLMPIYKKIRKV